MDEFRIWWAGALRSFFAWLGSVWQRFYYGVTNEWEVMYFIFGLGFVLIVGLIFMWRRKA